MRNSQSRSHKRANDTPALLVVDFDDLFASMRDRVGRDARPQDLISDILRDMREQVRRQASAHLVVARAYGDFALENAVDMLPRLYGMGVEAVHVNGLQQRNAAEQHLVIDTVTLLATRPDIRTVVLLSGQRGYGPLLRHVAETGRNVLALSVESLRDKSLLLGKDNDQYISLADVAPEIRRREEPPAVALTEPRNVQYLAVTDAIALRTLEVIEEHFGQYNEVYLTPLLRKLSDELGSEEIDPKNIISILETANAVVLEKRRGFPHDYTVLLVDPFHPDVDRIKQMFEDVDEDEYEDTDEEAS